MTPDPRRYHYLESTAAPDLAALIDAEAEQVWRRLHEPGSGGPLMCTTATFVWSAVLVGAGWTVFSEGTQLRKPAYSMYGGYLVPGERVPTDHHWLVVGPQMTLFDPTAGQFAGSGQPSAERYIASDGLPFVESRRRRLATGPGRGE